jgi:hypothetical protein
MKRILLSTLLITILGSCKKDNTTKTPTTVSIVGKWSYKSERVQILSSTGSVNSDVTTTNFAADQYVQYNADGTGVASDGGGSMVLYNYTINGNTDTEYQTPVSVGETPYVFTIAFTSTSLTRHSQTTANGQTTIIDDVFFR